MRVVRHLTLVKHPIVEVNKKEWEEVKLVEANLNFEKPNNIDLKFLRNNKTDNIMISTKEDFGLKSIKLYIINKIKKTHIANIICNVFAW